MDRDLAIITVYMLAGLSLINPLFSTLMAIVGTVTGMVVVSLSAKDVRNGAQAR